MSSVLVQYQNSEDKGISPIERTREENESYERQTNENITDHLYDSDGGESAKANFFGVSGRSGSGHITPT